MTTPDDTDEAADIPGHIVRALLRERDDARAKLAALETQYHADSERWIGERNDARAIARRLASDLTTFAVREAQEAFPTMDAEDLAQVAFRCAPSLHAFDALPWAKDEAEP